MDRSRSRRRAVTLTPEAYNLLQDRLLEVWAEEGRSGKLTREERARLLGVSVLTSDRLLKSQGVDRPTLILAFKNVGLSWKESYCELVPPTVSEEAPQQIAPSQQTVELQAPPAHVVERMQSPAKLRWSKRPLAALAAVVVALAGLSFFGETTTQTGTRWREELNASIHVGTKYYQKGLYPEAATWIGRGVNIAKANNDAAGMAEALRMWGDILAARGDYEQAGEKYTTALAIRRELGNPLCLPPILEALALMEIKLGRTASAEEHLFESLKGFRSTNDKAGIALASRGLGTLYLQVGNLHNASRWLGSALQIAQHLPSRDIEFDVRARRALLLRDQGRIDEARQELEACLEHWEAKAHPRWVATTFFQMATVEVAAGRLEAANALLTNSRATYERLGDQGGVRNCDEWLSRSSARDAASSDALPEDASVQMQKRGS